MDTQSVGGKEVPSDLVVQGELRYRWEMVEVMLTLYGSLWRRDGKAPNGCEPRWVQMLSDGCSPIAPCSVTLEKLGEHTGTSMVGHAGLDPPSDALVKGSQWTTLWAEHAHALYQDRDSIRDEWSELGSGLAYSGDDGPPAPWNLHKHSQDDALVSKLNTSLGAVTVDGVVYHGALDELVIPTELVRRGFSVSKAAMTRAVFGEAKYGHPETYNTAAAVDWVSKSAIYMNRTFARKFVGEEVMEPLLKLVSE